jgi:hypothetical protein
MEIECMKANLVFCKSAMQGTCKFNLRSGFYFPRGGRRTSEETLRPHDRIVINNSCSTTVFLVICLIGGVFLA